MLVKGGGNDPLDPRLHLTYIEKNYTKLALNRQAHLPY